MPSARGQGAAIDDFQLGGTLKWTEHPTSYVLNIKRAHFQPNNLLRHNNRNVKIASACFQAAGYQPAWAEGQKVVRAFFLDIRKRIPLPAEAVSPSSAEQAPEAMGKTLPKKGRQNPEGFAHLQAGKVSQSQTRKEATGVSILNHPNQNKKIIQVNCPTGKKGKKMFNPKQ